ncbi:MAG: HEPN domain-containing protein [Candidatus Pacebacteria bacterium]|nr:HEPN domain-containing protein [Candidatus Paceibacterota bacterium]MDD5013070.1 HEPN domain-containing protein [Candidatus Paceibacterota bacterium]MDD5752973.1 HEPN domain-containing protein [Candidatus Paceibacterota bacterium]
MQNKEVQKCIERNKIVELENAISLIPKELEMAQEDLKCAKGSFLSNNYKWSTVQSYYSMFHTSRSLLYNKGYREKSHYCLIEAIRAFYIEEISFDFIEALQLGRTLRENADYYGDFSKESAEEMVNMAEKFFEKAKEILGVK